MIFIFPFIIFKKISIFLTTKKNIPINESANNEVYYYRALSLVSLKDWDKAIEALDMLLEKIPHKKCLETRTEDELHLPEVGLLAAPHSTLEGL